MGAKNVKETTVYKNLSHWLCRYLNYLNIFHLKKNIH